MPTAVSAITIKWSAFAAMLRTGVGRLGQHRVHRDHDGLADLLQERRQVIDVRALDPGVALPRLVLPQAVQTELVLDADDVGVRSPDRASRGDVPVGRALPYPPAHLGPVGADRVALVDRRDLTDDRLVGGVHRLDEVAGERGDPASP
jgi:hypothetical protein